MKVIVCLDDKNGMLFNHRRQSSDHVLCKRILALTENSRLRMNFYSAEIFGEHISQIVAGEDFLYTAKEEDFCFLENVDIVPYAEKVNTVIIYRWNRIYPSDVKFPVQLFERRWKLISRDEFAGSSHERITEEIYRL